MMSIAINDWILPAESCIGISGKTIAGLGIGGKVVYRAPESGGDVIWVESIAISPSSRTIPVGSGYQFTATVTPANATNKAVQWSSASPATVTVDQTGYVKRIKSGMTTVAAEAADGSGAKKTVMIM